LLSKSLAVLVAHNGANHRIIGSHKLFENLRLQDQSTISSTICRCGHTCTIMLRLVKRLVAPWEVWSH